MFLPNPHKIHTQVFKHQQKKREEIFFAKNLFSFYKKKKSLFLLLLEATPTQLSQSSRHTPFVEQYQTSVRTKYILTKRGKEFDFQNRSVLARSLIKTNYYFN